MPELTEDEKRIVRWLRSGAWVRPDLDDRWWHRCRAAWIVVCHGSQILRGMAIFTAAAIESGQHRERG